MAVTWKISNTDYTVKGAKVQIKYINYTGLALMKKQ